MLTKGHRLAINITYSDVAHPKTNLVTSLALGRLERKTQIILYNHRSFKTEVTYPVSCLRKLRPKVTVGFVQRCLTNKRAALCSCLDTELSTLALRAILPTQLLFH